MLLDAYLRHYDVVERHETLVRASREAAWRVVTETDFVHVLARVVRAVLEMRDVPPSIRAIAHRARRLPPDTAFTLADALAGPFILLGERSGRATAIGAIGKLWKPDVTFLPLDRAEFRAFHDPKYAKLAIAFWTQRFGRGKSVVRLEVRATATDDSARAHLQRWYRVVRPYTAFFMRQALAHIKADAEAIAAPTRA